MTAPHVTVQVHRARAHDGRELAVKVRGMPCLGCISEPAPQG